MDGGEGVLEGGKHNGIKVNETNPLFKRVVCLYKYIKLIMSIDLIKLRITHYQ